MERGRISFFPPLLLGVVSRFEAAAQRCGSLPRLLRRQRCFVNGDRGCFSRNLPLCSGETSARCSGSNLAARRATNNKNRGSTGSSTSSFRYALLNSSFSNTNSKSRGNNCSKRGSSTNNSSSLRASCRLSSWRGSDSNSGSSLGNCSSRGGVSSFFCGLWGTSDSSSSSILPTAALGEGITSATLGAPVTRACSTAAGVASAAAGAAANLHGETLRAAASRRRVARLTHAACFYGSSRSTKNSCLLYCAQHEGTADRRGLCAIVLAVCCAAVQKRDEARRTSSSKYTHSDVGPTCLREPALVGDIAENEVNNLASGSAAPPQEEGQQQQQQQQQQGRSARCGAAATAGRSLPLVSRAQGAPAGVGTSAAAAARAAATGAAAGGGGRAAAATAGVSTGVARGEAAGAEEAGAEEAGAETAVPTGCAASARLAASSDAPPATATAGISTPGATKRAAAARGTAAAIQTDASAALIPQEPGLAAAGGTLLSCRINACSSAARDKQRHKTHASPTAAANFSSSTSSSTAPAAANSTDGRFEVRTRCVRRRIERATAAAAQGKRRRQQQVRYAAPARGASSRFHVRENRLVRRKKEKTKAGIRTLFLSRRMLGAGKSERRLQKFSPFSPHCCTVALKGAACAEQQEAEERRQQLQQDYLQLLQQSQQDQGKLLQQQQEQRRQEQQRQQTQQQRQPGQHQQRQHQRPQPWWKRQQPLELPQQQQRTGDQPEADGSAPKRPLPTLESAENVVNVMQQIAPCVVRVYRVSLGHKGSQQLLQSTATSGRHGSGSGAFSSSSHTASASSRSSTACAGGSSGGSSLCASGSLRKSSSSCIPAPGICSSSSHAVSDNSVLAACCCSSCTASNGDTCSNRFAVTKRNDTVCTNSNAVHSSDSLGAHGSSSSSRRVTAGTSAMQQRPELLLGLRSSTHAEGREAEAGTTAQYLGSGFIYSPRGLVVTAAHLFVQEQQHADAELAEAAADAAQACSSPATLEAAASAGPSTAAAAATGRAAGDKTAADIDTDQPVAAVAVASPASATTAAAACTALTSTGVATAADATAEIATAAPAAAGGKLVTTEAAEAAGCRYVVELADGRLLHATLKGRSSTADVAVLQLDLAPDEQQLPAVSLPSFSGGQPLRPSQGEVVIAYGAPQHADESVGVVGRVSQSRQRFSSLSVSSPPVPFLQLGILTLPGMSGSPVCNLQGQVVGMLAKKFHECGLALPIHFVASVASQLAATGVYRPPFLGLLLLNEEDRCAAVASFASETQRQQQQPYGRDGSRTSSSRRRNALVIDSVVEGSAAAAAGLRRGDVLTAVDDRPIGCLPELLDHLTAKHPDSLVKISVLRGQHLLNCTVALGIREV